MNHILWLKHFIGGSSNNQESLYSMEEIMACFSMLVWLVPLSFLIACTTDATSLPQYGKLEKLILGEKQKRENFVKYLYLKIFKPNQIMQGITSGV